MQKMLKILAGTIVMSIGLAIMAYLRDVEFWKGKKSGCQPSEG